MKVSPWARFDFSGASFNGAVPDPVNFMGGMDSNKTHQ
jgi:hypothetical protein